MKISDHHVRSPLLNVNRACQTCHQWPETELVARVETIQTRHFKLRDQAMNALVALIKELQEAKARGKGDEELAKAQALQRRAQFYLDFVEAENSTGFHAPQEAARVLAESIDFARQGQLEVRAVVGGCPSCAPPCEADARGGEGGAAADAGAAGAAPAPSASATAAAAAPSKPPARAPAAPTGAPKDVPLDQRW